MYPLTTVSAIVREWIILTGFSSADAATIVARARGADTRLTIVYADISNLQNILPNLIEWVVGTVGADRVPFGTDMPLCTAGIDSASLDDSAKRQIVCGNVLRSLTLNID